MTEKDSSEKLRWFPVMWSNGFIVIFIMALLALLVVFQKANEIIKDAGYFWLIIAMGIPITVISMIAYLGFYKFWIKLKKERNQ